MKHLAIAFLLTALILAACSNIQRQGLETKEPDNILALATRMAKQLSGTVEAGQAGGTATAQAVSNIQSQALKWPVVISDPFDNNQSQWSLGSEESDLSIMEMQIKDGKFHWEATAKDGFIYWATPEMKDVGDFYLTVEGRMLGGPADGDYGLVFRKVDDDNYYMFQINHQQQYAVEMDSNGDWQTLIDWQVSDAIQAGQANTISVIGSGQNFSLYINEQLVNTVQDASFSTGKIGVVVGLYNPGDSGIFEFDNLILRAP